MDRRTVIGGGLVLTVATPALAALTRPRVVMRTGKGVIVVELAADRAPITCANFLHYVGAGKYDGGEFFRTVRTPGRPEEGQVVGRTRAGQRPFPPIAHEPTTKTGLRHVAGTLSLGRFEIGSATSDFFICVSDEPYLDAHPGAPTKPGEDNQGFAAFGSVVKGMEAVRRIHASPTGGGASPFADQRHEWLHPPVPILSMRPA